MANTSRKKPEAPKTENAQAVPEVAVVEVTISQKNLETPHSIELRRDENGKVYEARLHDHKCSEVIGAKTVETILRETGLDPHIPDEKELTIKISPHTGEVISIEPAVKTAAPVEATEENEPPPTGDVNDSDKTD